MNSAWDNLVLKFNPCNWLLVIFAYLKKKKQSYYLKLKQ